MTSLVVRQDEKRGSAEAEACSGRLLGLSKKRQEFMYQNVLVSLDGLNVAEQVVDFAKRNSIDFIVMATRGRSGVSRKPYGSVAEKVMYASSIPILVVIPSA